MIQGFMDEIEKTSGKIKHAKRGITNYFKKRTPGKIRNRKYNIAKAKKWKASKAADRAKREAEPKLSFYERFGGTYKNPTRVSADRINYRAG